MNVHNLHSSYILKIVYKKDDNRSYRTRVSMILSKKIKILDFYAILLIKTFPLM